jgi:hypothetical protein
MAEKVVYVFVSTGKRIAFIKHYSIFVTDGADYNYVYQCTLDSDRIDGGCIVKTDYTEFLKDHNPIYYFKTELTEQDVINKVAELDTKRWLPFIFTCSDFTRRVTKLSPFWSQKNQLIAGIVFVTALIVLNKVKF